MIRKLEWDSAFFGLAMAHLDHEAFVPGSSAAWAARMEREGLDFIQTKVPVGDAARIRELEDAGFRFADLRMTFAAKPEAIPHPARAVDAARFVPAKQADERELCRFAPSLFADSRYFGFDAHFPPSRVRDLYAEWIRKAIRGTWDDRLYKYVANGEAVGFVTVRLCGDSASIGLIGVRSDCRRQGIGGALLGGLALALRAEAVPLLTVATQGQNIAAQNLYMKSNFQLNAVEAWYYRFAGGRSERRDSV